MKRLVLLCALVSLVPVISARAETPKKGADAIVGKWWFPKKNGKMEIKKEGNVYNGKVIAYDKEGQLDEKNPDPKLQTRPFVGIEMLRNFKHDAEAQKWSGGTIYDGDSGKTYKCNMWFDGDDLQNLNARGYVGLSVFGRTEVFTRVTPEDEAAEKTAQNKEPANEKAEAAGDGK
jgi:uncharacterized protein (DUF2147 family)